MASDDIGELELVAHAVSIWVDGIPKAQPRPKAWARKMGGVHVARIYTPGTAEEWKALVAVAAAPHRPASPIEGPVRFHVAFRLPRPKNRYRKRDPRGELWCTSKPDWDNLAKAIADCCTQQGWWRDDAQIVDTHITKQWHAIGERPGALIRIQEIGT